MIICLIGLSGSGKTTVLHHFLDAYGKAFGFENLITYTTRQQRPNEIQAKHYHFISKSEFNTKKEQGALIATTHYDQQWYGLEKKDINPHANYLIVVDVGGALELKKLLGAKIVLITAKENIIVQRLERRSTDKIDDRLLVNQKEQKLIDKNLKKIDCTLENADLVLCLDRLKMFCQKAITIG